MVRRISRTMFVRAAEMVRRPGLFRAENNADACRSFAAVEWHYSDRRLWRFQHPSTILKKTTMLWPMHGMAGSAYLTRRDDAQVSHQDEPCASFAQRVVFIRTS